MRIHPINSDEDYRAALALADTLFDAEPGTPEGDRREVLTTLIQAYEERHWRVDLPDPIDAIRIRMAEEGPETAVRQARAQRAVSRIRKRARDTGLDQLADQEIEEEIRQARAERAGRAR